MKTKEECINYILLSINMLETNLELIGDRNSYKFLSNSTTGNSYLNNLSK